MCTEGRKVNVGFSEEPIPEGTHMCMIYNSDAERRQVISRFLSSGLGEKERVGYFADMMEPEEVRDWLRSLQIELPEDPHDTSFSVNRALDVYCPGGHFDPEEMCDRLRTYHDQTEAEGFVGARVSGEMTWALKGIPGSERLIEYEARVNTVFTTHPLTAICQYDASRFDGATIFEVLRVHPMMVVRGQIVRNPYYVTAEDYFREIGRE
jgi:hypothetical protein